ncbi:glycoside hydrolase family 2 TIM barrel-domain containing protein [Rubripirellula reticaptiva]|uniref:Beta-galactosidase n=1 Tax=Rubripirellula reticaptiva TaxID=2528013 RepID=A0A5C6EEL6_9BACT|nr:glycoside hydrolase family 2 TIM barrel-domain containing protein [Rubripirellula reticaptiva]TWU46935.1 Beta-galactosidase [Rubripirellula reticaptiva]
MTIKDPICSRRTATQFAPNHKILLTLLAVLLLSISWLPGTVLADRTSFDKDWQFIQQDVPGAEQPDFDDSAWRQLDVPHDWSVEGEYDENNQMGAGGGYLPAGIGWYRKTISVPADWRGKHIEIAFDGIFMNSTVWANGQKLGNRPYGWSSFSYDVSKLAQESQSITFAIRVDNERQPSARWYTGSGIYAHTWIDVKNPLHVPASGVFIRTNGSTVEIDTEVTNTTSGHKNTTLKVSIIDAEGATVASVQTEFELAASDIQTISQKIKLDNPQRWSLETPILYTARTEVLLAGKSIDRMETKFGVRDVQWKPESGMWINGKNLKLRGVCNHQDAGALGTAVPDKVLRYRIEQLKKMGCNAIRTTHNPQTPVFYDICDEVGMLVMDEIFDGWGRKAANDYGAHYFKQWWQRDLTDWIKRDRNHPSIVIYSVGNETHGDVGKDLVAMCHKLDSTRPVTSGHSGSEFMDVFGVNGGSEKMGWFAQLPNDRVFIGTENTHTWQVRGFYRTLTWYRDGYPNAKQKPHETPDLTETEVFTNDWTQPSNRKNRKQIFNSSYDNAMVRLNARKNIEQLRDIPNYAGSFRWTGYDYIGEAGYVHGGWPFKAFMGGAIDMANFEKDLYYLYQSQWTQQPMVHILPHWTHPTMKPGTEIPVWVYSNCDEVELFFDGDSLGRRTPGNKSNEMQCQWMVGWRPGELKAVGYKQGNRVAEQVVRTADEPAQIALSIDGEPLADSGKDIVQVRVTTTDEQGEFYPYGENRTHFHLIGPGKIRALDNGSPVDVERHFQAHDRIAFYGLTRAYIESTGEAGDIALLASCILGEKKQVTSNRVRIDTKLLSLRGTLPDVKTDVFYTLDGSVPTPQSTRYTDAFPVPLGTTVKALVVANGTPVQFLEERFAQDVGFVWDVVQKAARPGGDQAEDATFSKAVVDNQGKNFNGTGYLDFGQNKGAYVQWYQENDGDAGQTELVIRYSGVTKGRPGRAVKVTVNGKTVQEKLLLPNTKNWGKDWRTVTINIPVQRGANTIRLTTIENGGMYIDEITVK